MEELRFITFRHDFFAKLLIKNKADINTTDNNKGSYTVKNI